MKAKTQKRVTKFVAIFLAALFVLSAFSVVLSIGFTASAVSHSQLPVNIVVGYWHNFSNGSTVTKLRDVNPGWDVINVSFLITETDNNTAFFEPDDAVYSGTLEQRKAEFKSDVQYLQQQGKKVVVSIGGETGRLEIANTAARDNFLATSKAIIDEYGFDGLDVDLENTSVKMDAADKIGSLSSVFQTGITYILHDLKSTYGSDFIISMAPEHVYVQSGITSMSGSWGAYLPFLDACRDILTYIHPQYYNNPIDYWMPDGSRITGYNSNSMILLSEMLIDGFDTEKGHFDGLRPDQVAFGVPCSSRAATSGFQSIAEYQTALRTLIEKYPTFRGIMTWSTNWDEVNGNAFVTGMREVIGSPTYAEPVYTVSISADKSGTVNAGEQITWSVTTENAGSSESFDFDVYKDGVLYVDSAASASKSFSYTPKEAGVYTVKVTAVSGTQQSTASSQGITVVIPSMTASISSNAGSNAEVGNAITWTTSVQGGTGTKSYAIDVYCYNSVVASGTSASLTYTPATAGTYYAKVTVTDSLGVVSTATSEYITVKKPLTVSVAYSSGTLTGGSAISMKITSDGGVGGKTYSAYVLKDGKIVSKSVSITADSFTFTPSESGVYTVRVYAQDDDMVRAVGSTTVTVA